MFSRDDLQQLAEYQGQHAVLSLTLNVDPTRRTKDEYRLALRHLLHSVQGRANGDAASIERFFESEYDWSGRGLAIFSSQKENFWKVYSLAVPIVDSIFLGPKPHLTPLANLWDVYGRFVVALIDKQGARFIFVQMGEVVDGEGILGEEVRRVKSGAGSTPTGRRRNPDEPTDRHVQEVIKRNVKDYAHALQQFCEKHTPRYVVLGGNAEIVNEVRAHLGAALGRARHRHDCGRHRRFRSGDSRSRLEDGGRSRSASASSVWPMRRSRRRRRTATGPCGSIGC